MKLFKKSMMLAVVAAALSAGVNAATYKIATNVADDSNAGRLLGEFAQNVDKATQGRVKFKIFSNGVLGDQLQYFQQVQKGIIDAGLVNGAALENVIPAFGVLNLPYVFRTSEEYAKVLTHPEVKKALFASTSEHNFATLGFFASGFRSIYTTKPVKSMKDLAGMKLRTMSSETYIEMLKSFGAVPTPLPFGELYSGLQMGVIDGAEGGLAGMAEAKFGEVAKFAINSEQTRLTDFVVTSLKFRQSVKPEDLAIVQAEFDKISAKSVAQSDETEAKGIERAVKEMGVTLTKVDKAPFMKAVEPMYKKALNDKNKGALLKVIFDIEGRKF